MKLINRIFFVILLFLVLVFSIVYLIGRTLPVEHTVSISENFSLPADKMYLKLRNYHEYVSWQKNLKSVESLGESSWKETDSHGDTISYSFVKEEPNRILETKIMDEDLPFGGSWKFEILETKEGCRLTITENGSVYSPIFRFVSNYIMGHDSTIKTYLEYLNSDLNPEKSSQ